MLLVICLCAIIVCATDVTIAPEHSFVVEVEGQELCPTDAFDAKLTIRFPHVVKLRPDKVIGGVGSVELMCTCVQGCKDVTRLSEVVKLFNNRGVGRSFDVRGVQQSKKRKREVGVATRRAIPNGG